ncbi:MAG TPA: ABC transporter permease [Alphaproteobacteria bacterium]|nr:ABC transporter permease [Alphaproteobacteria bacterium]
MVQVVEKKWRDKVLLVSAGPPSLVQILFLLVPLGMLLVLTFQTIEFYQLTWTWNLDTWNDVFSKTYYWKTLGNTLMMGAICVVLSYLIGFPVAYALATRFKAFENHIKVLMIFAFLTDIVLKTYGWVIILDKEGLVNWAFHSLGLVPASWENGLVFTPIATMGAMVYNLVPFMIFTIYLSVINVDRDLLNAAYDCGASKLRAFWEVTLPLCRPGIWAGLLLVFILSLGVFIEEKVPGGGKAPMMGSLVHQTFGTRVNWPLGAALTVVLMIVAIGLIFAFTRLYRVDRYRVP